MCSMSEYIHVVPTCPYIYQIYISAPHCSHVVWWETFSLYSAPHNKGNKDLLWLGEEKRKIGNNWHHPLLKYQDLPGFMTTKMLSTSGLSVSCYFWSFFNRLERLYFTAAFNGNQTTADSINTHYRGEINLRGTERVHSTNLYHMIEVSTDQNIHHLLLFLIMLNSARKKLQTFPWFAPTVR